jgi:hypothetical protein
VLHCTASSCRKLHLVLWYCRSLFPGVVATTQQALEAVGKLEAAGEVAEAGGKVVQVEELCMRITMDVLGLLLRDRCVWSRVGGEGGRAVALLGAVYRFLTVS